MKFLKTIAITVVAATLMTSVVSCKPSNSANGSAPLVEMKVEGDAVPENLYQFIFRYVKYQLDQGDEAFWKQENGSVDQEKLTQLKQQTEDEIRQIYALRKLAEQNNVSLDEQDKQSMADSMSDMIDQYGGEEALVADLQKNGLDLEVYQEFFLEQSLLGNNLLLALYRDDIVEQVDPSRFFRAQHILIKFPDDTSESAASTAADSASTAEKKNHEDERKRAEEILKRLEQGEDFDKLMQELGEDPGATTHPEGYYFIEGQMVSAFYEATKALKENEISGIVESEYGYHIIKRLPVVEAELIQYLKSTDALLQYVGSEVQEDFENKITELAQKLEVTYGQGHAEITYHSFDLSAASESAPESSADSDSQADPQNS